VKLCRGGGYRGSFAERCITTMRTTGGEDQISLKLQGRLGCFGGAAGTAVVPASAWRPARVPLPFCRRCRLLTLQLPQPRHHSLAEQEEALTAALGLLSFPFD